MRRTSVQLVDASRVWFAKPALSERERHTFFPIPYDVYIQFIWCPKTPKTKWMKQYLQFFGWQMKTCSVQAAIQSTLDWNRAWSSRMSIFTFFYIGHIYMLLCQISKVGTRFRKISRVGTWFRRCSILFCSPNSWCLDWARWWKACISCYAAQELVWNHIVLLSCLENRIAGKCINEANQTLVDVTSDTKSSNSE